MGYNHRNDEIHDNIVRMQRAWEAERDALATVRRFNAWLSAKGPVWFWPKIAAAITAKHPWLVIVCDSCGTVVDLARAGHDVKFFHNCRGVGGEPKDCLELQRRRLQAMLQVTHLASDASSAAWSMQKLSNCFCGLVQVPFGALLEQGSHDHETGDHACWWRPCGRAPHRRLAETSRSRNQV